MATLHLVLILALSWASAVTAQDPEELHPDIVQVIPVVGANPGGSNWANSYSVNGKCYCIMPNSDAPIGDGIDQYPIETPKGWMTVKEACLMIGSGGSPSGNPLYNDVQCGNGPPNDLGNEHFCPGRVDVGKRGCGQIGPTWDFGGTSTLPVPPVQTQTYFNDVGGPDEDMNGFTSDGRTWPWKNSTKIQNTMKDKWYQSHRSAASFTYTLDGFTPSVRYRVTLGFAEVYFKNCQIGKRIQDIIIQGEKVLENLDVYAVAGCCVALQESFDAFVKEDGKISIAIIATKEYAMLSTIQIEPARNSPPLPPRVPPPPPPPAPSVPSGLEALIVIDAGTKTEDLSLVSDDTWTYAISNTASIKNTQEPQMFRSHRSAPMFTYTLPNLTPNAEYKLYLGWSEIWQPNCSNGKRIMQVKVNGETMKDIRGQTDIDVYRIAGCASALVKIYTVNADAGGELVVEIGATVENAMISVIKLFSDSDQIYIDAGSDQGEDMSLIKGTTRTSGISSSELSREFRTHRWGKEFTYTLVGFSKNKTYLVRLGFSETYGGACSDGKRLFQVKINEKVVEQRLDVFKESGCRKPLERLYEIKPDSNGRFVMHFNSMTNNAMVSFIDIKPKN